MMAFWFCGWISATTMSMLLLQAMCSIVGGSERTKRCGFNAGHPSACHREADISLTLDIDGKEGKTYLCDYHAGAFAALVCNFAEDSESEDQRAFDE